MRAHGWPDGRIPMLLSAHAEDLIGPDAAAIAAYLDRTPDASAGDVAAHLLRTRRIRRHRAVLRAADRAELSAALRALAAGADHPLVSRAADVTGGRIAFVFPGQGGQWPGMGAEAYAHVPAYRAAADDCAAAFQAAGVLAPLGYLCGEPGPAFTEIEVEGAQFVHHVALASVWRSCGVLPDVTIGHSLGEIAAAYVAGVIGLPDAVAVVATRAGVVDRLSGSYAVAALGISAADASEVIARTPGWLELAVVNAATSVAVSGDRAAVLTAVAAVQAVGRFAREITVNFPVHTSVLDALRDELHPHWPVGEFAESPIQFIGGTTGDVVPAGTRSADYWYRNLRDTVRFDRAVASAARRGVAVFAEMSVHPALLSAAADVLGDDPAVLIGSGRRGELLVDRLSAGIATVVAADPSCGYPAMRPATALRGFPNAPMRAVHLWAAPAPRPAPLAPLTVLVEQWQVRQAATPAGRRAVAVVDRGDPALAHRLIAALSRNPVVAVSDPSDADLLVVVAPHSVVDIAASTGEGFFGYTGAIGPQTRDVWLVTTGAEQVEPGDPVPSPTAAALAAMHRSIGFEHPDQGFHHLDVTPIGNADTVIEVLLAGTGEAAVRGDVGYQRALGAAPAAEPWALDSGVLDEVVITGGSGVIGMHYTEYLAAHGAKRIVLLSRGGLDPAVLGPLSDRYGTELSALRCDITDPDAVGAAARVAAPATLLIHAAGTAAFETRTGLTTAATADTLRAKVDGLRSILDHWPLRPDARILLCSSVIGVWGGKGAAAYAAGNRMLDAVAADLRSQGRRCTSMRWGLWQGHGANSGIADAAETDRVQRSGLRPMNPHAAIAVSLCDHPVDPLVLHADGDRLQLFLGGSEVAAEPDGADPAEVVRVHLAAVLDIADPAEIDSSASLFDLGIDSLLALELRKRLKRTLGRTVPLARLLGGITGTELVAELTDETERTEKMESSRD